MVMSHNMKSNMNHYQCWYRPVCKNVDTVHCTDVCVSFYEMLHLLEQSGIPQNLFSKIDLVPDNSDIEAFKQLKYIKDNIPTINNKIIITFLN